MKRILLITAIIINALAVFSQTPGGFKYQTVVRDGEGHLQTNQQVTLTMEILQGSINGDAVCSETFSATTNEFGLVNLEIGSQEPDEFAAIDWANGPYYLKVALDGTVMGTSELLSVPYSMYSKKAKEFLPPQMTRDEMLDIENPPFGTLVLCTDCEPDGTGALTVYKYGNWYKLLTEIIESSGCPGIPFVIYEGQTYNTVQIGAQCWLKENLNVGLQIDGDLDQQDNGIIEKYCYDDLPANCEIYGGLYQWEEIMKYTTVEGAQGICPEGWHIPTDAEWCQLTTFIDESVDCGANGPTGTDACLKMKTTSGWNSGGNGTNEYGFSGLPAGVRFPGYFSNIGNGTDFWTSTYTSTPGAYYWVLYYSNNFTGRYILALDWYCGVSVRCLKDE